MTASDIHSIESLDTVSMELSSRCNLRCRMCSHHTNTRPVISMSLDQFKLIIDKLMKTRIRNLFLNMSEPFMNKSIFMMISYAKRNGFSVFISTNGQLLTPTHMQNIIKTGVEVLKFSIEGYTPEVYKRIRVGGDFENLVRNVYMMKELRDQSGSPLRIRISTIMMKENEDIVEFIKFWGPYCDEIECTTITNHIGLVDNKKISLSPAWKNRRSCPQIKPYREINILANGDMVICCIDFHGRCILGNLLTQEIDEIWNSPKITEIRQKAYSDETLDLDPCRECFIADYSNIFQGNIQHIVNVIHETVKNNMWDTLEHIKYIGNTGAACSRCGKPVHISFAGYCLSCIENK